VVVERSDRGEANLTGRTDFESLGEMRTSFANIHQGPSSTLNRPDIRLHPPSSADRLRHLPNGRRPYKRPGTARASPPQHTVTSAVVAAQCIKSNRLPPLHDPPLWPLPIVAIQAIRQKSRSGPRRPGKPLTEGGRDQGTRSVPGVVAIRRRSNARLRVSQLPADPLHSSARNHYDGRRFQVRGTPCRAGKCRK
jgi:hypothetical protein